MVSYGFGLLRVRLTKGKPRRRGVARQPKVRRCDDTRPACSGCTPLEHRRRESGVGVITSGLVLARVIAARSGGGGGGGELHLAGLRGAWRHGAHGGSLQHRERDTARRLRRLPKVVVEAQGHRAKDRGWWAVSSSAATSCREGHRGDGGHAECVPLVPLLRLEQQPALREQRVVLRCRRQQAAPVALERSGARSGRVASCWVVRRWGARELHDS